MNINLDNSKVPRCQHVKADGVQCNNPAMKHVRFCYYHAQIERTMRAPHRPAANITIDSVAAIRIGLTDVLNRLSRGVIDHRDARLMLRGLQNATTLLKIDVTLPEQHDDIDPVTDINALERHVIQLSRDLRDRLNTVGPKTCLRLMNSAAANAREKALAEAAATSHGDSSDIGPCLYTMTPDEYDDANEPAPLPPPPDFSNENLDDLDDDEREREITRRKEAIRATLPPVAEGEPARCLLIDNPTCPFSNHPGERTFTCPTADACEHFRPRVYPDLAPHLDDPTRCRELHLVAKELAEFGDTLQPGLRDGYGRFVPAPDALPEAPPPEPPC